MNGDLRIALAGCGAIGELVARRVYASSPPGCRVVAAVDRVPSRAAAAGDLLGVPSFEFVADVPAVDAVDIRLPHDGHAAAVLAALVARWPFATART